MEPMKEALPSNPDGTSSPAGCCCRRLRRRARAHRRAGGVVEVGDLDQLRAAVLGDEQTRAGVGGADRVGRPALLRPAVAEDDVRGRVRGAAPGEPPREMIPTARPRATRSRSSSENLSRSCFLPTVAEKYANSSIATTYGRNVSTATTLRRSQSSRYAYRRSIMICNRSSRDLEIVEVAHPAGRLRVRLVNRAMFLVVVPATSVSSSSPS
jgi:hypothetical protein